MKALTYRILEADEWPKLKKIFDKYEQTPPPPDVSTVAVAEDENGGVVGCLVLQLVAHMEPLLIRDPKVNFLRLQGTLEDALKQELSSLESNAKAEYYCFSHTDKVNKMAELAGMQKTPYKVWWKEVN